MDFGEGVRKRVGPENFTPPYDSGSVDQYQCLLVRGRYCGVIDGFVFGLWKRYNWTGNFDYF